MGYPALPKIQITLPTMHRTGRAGIDLENCFSTLHSVRNCFSSWVIMSWFKIKLVLTQIYQLFIWLRGWQYFVPGEYNLLIPTFCYLDSNVLVSIFFRECNLRSIGRPTEQSFSWRSLLLSSESLNQDRLCTMCTEFRGPVEDVVEVEEG